MKQFQTNFKGIRIAKLFLISLLFFNTPSLFSQTDSISVVKVKVNSNVIDLLKTWDINIWFFTPMAKPVSSIEGLTRNEFACWGIDLFQKMQDLYKTLELGGEGVKLMGDGAYNDELNKPLIYVTWAKVAPNLKNVTRVVFVAE